MTVRIYAGSEPEELVLMCNCTEFEFMHCARNCFVSFYKMSLKHIEKDGIWWQWGHSRSVDFSRQHLSVILRRVEEKINSALEWCVGERRGMHASSTTEVIGFKWSTKWLRSIFATCSKFNNRGVIKNGIVAGLVQARCTGVHSEFPTRTRSDKNAFILLTPALRPGEGTRAEQTHCVFTTSVHRNPYFRCCRVKNH